MHNPALALLVSTAVIAGADDLVMRGGARAAIAADPLPAMRVAANCAGWSRIESVRTTGAVEEIGEHVHGPYVERYDARDGRERLDQHTGPYLSISGFDGATEWLRDYSSGAHRYDSAHAIALGRSDAWIEHRGWCAANGATYSSLGPTTIAGRTADLILANPRAGVPVQLAIDTATHLPISMRVRQNENSIVITYGDWRGIRKIPYPFEETFADPEDGGAIKLATEHVTFLPRLPDKTYAMPPTPSDARVLGGSDVARVPYELDGEKVIVPVTLDGTGPFPFVLDTGGHLLVTQQTLHRLHRTGVGDYARFREIRIGSGAVLGDQVAEIHKYKFAKVERGPRTPKAGWLGLEFLERFATTFDPRSHTIVLRRLDRPRPTPAGVKVAMTFDQDAPLIDCAIDGRLGPCMIDTGNAPPTIIEPHWWSGTPLATRIHATGVHMGDDIDEAYGDVRIASLDIPRELLRLYPPQTDGSESTTVESSILSERLLNQFVMTIDAGRHSAWFQPIAGASESPFDRCGVQIDKQADGSFVVWNVLAASPATAAGFALHDRIIRIDGVPAKQLSAADFYERNQGTPGTLRTFVVIRHGAHKATTIHLRLRELLR